MFYVDDEDATLKTSPVRPNDVLDIEVSPLGSFIPSICKSLSNQRKDYNQSPAGKTHRLKGKFVKVGPSRVKKRQADSMSRGDPFLSSVISDESPIADYPLKNSRKKPSDCKCKGFGYNLSPSALLPEEMRQQWGVGVFGKPSTPSSRIGVSPGRHSVISSLGLCSSESDNISTLQYFGANKNYPSSPVNHAFTPAPIHSPVAKMSTEVSKCQLCFQNPCSCYDFSLPGFRIPIRNEPRKIKTGIRTAYGKIKDSGIPSPYSCKSPSMKRIPCYSCKENSNIISTSNFNKNNTSTSMALDRNYVSPSYDPGFFKAGFSCRTPNRTKANFSGAGLGKGYSSNEFQGVSRTSLMPKIRPRQLIRPPRRVLANVTNQSLPCDNLSPNMNMFDRNKTFQRSGSQMLVLGSGSHSCSCDICRRTPSYPSRLESPEYHHQNNSQHMVPPILSSSQKFKVGSVPTTVSVPIKRYHPYSAGQYAYSQNTRQLYHSPERYSCPSPPFDYEGRRYPIPQPSSTPLSLAQDLSAFEASFSYLDNDVFSSPANSPAEVKDLLDLSVQETVDFFLNLKPPYIIPSSPLQHAIQEPQDEGMPSFYSSSFLIEDDLPSPTTDIQPSSTFCSSSGPVPSLGLHGSMPFIRPQLGDMNFSRQQTQLNRPNRRKQSLPANHSRSLPSKSMSLLYSTLVSDLEDELRSAIDNIPV